MYYTTIPLVSERPHNKRWDASKLRELRKRLDSGTMTTEEVDQVAADFMDGEIVDLASDWLGNTVSLSLSRWVCVVIDAFRGRSFKNSLRSVRLPQDLQCWNASPLIWR